MSISVGKTLAFLAVARGALVLFHALGAATNGVPGDLPGGDGEGGLMPAVVVGPVLTLGNRVSGGGLGARCLGHPPSTPALPTRCL